MKKLLLIGASNYVSQIVIKKLKDIETIVGVSLEEKNDRHQDYLALDQANLHKEFFDITVDFPIWLDKLLVKYGYFDGFLYMPRQNCLKPLLKITKEEFDKSALIN